jgi:outer membrane receptor for ferrienterochelin and colicins
MRLAVAIIVLGIIFGSASAALADVYGAVSGVVLDADHHPVSGATIKLAAPDESTRTTRTDSSGRYRFAQVPFDTYTVTAEAAGFAPSSAVVTVLSGNAVIVDFHLSVKTIGRVVTSAATSVTGQPVSVNVISEKTIAALPNGNSLQRIVQTVPGIVPFSYNEPVARGFHGVTYEIDGVPLPQTAGQYFSEALDPRDVDRLEVFTGAMPAEFGGQRQGAVVDVLTKSANQFTGPDGGTVSLFGGSYSSAGVSLDQVAGSGDFRAFLNLNLYRDGRGLDSPTPIPDHDNSNQSDGFARLLFSPSQLDTLAFNYSAQYAAFQIPIDTNRNDPNNPNWAVAGTDDNQHEYQRFSNLTFNHQSADGNGFVEITPWWSSDRLTYLPDPANDLASASQSSTFQDRYSNFVGVAAAYARDFGNNSLKIGENIDVQNMQSQFNILFIDPNTGKLAPPFDDNVSHRGSNTGVYAEDKLNLTNYVTMDAGLRWDNSSGFVSGHQISPRISVNLQADPQDIVHVYYGRLYAAPALEDTRRDAIVVDTGVASNRLPVYDLKPERDSIYEAGVAHTFTPLVNGFITLWARHVNNVLDTTQIGSTPLFTVFNSAGGQSSGMELRLNGRTYHGNSWYFSYGTSYSIAEGISGGTFNFPVSQLQGANSWALEDHDQTNTINADYTFSLSPSGRYASLQTLFGSGFPVQFENGTGRLPAHWELGASYGEPASRNRIGWELSGTNLLNHLYLIKVANGFNSTQYAAGRRITFKLTAPVY